MVTSDQPAIYDLEAERQVLGILMVTPKHYAEIAIIVTAQDFWRGAHRTIYEAIEAVYAADRVVDSVSVSDALSVLGRLDAVGGLAYLSDLTVNVGPTANVDHYASKVAGLARRRRIAAAALTLHRDIADLTVDVDEALFDAGDALFDFQGDPDEPDVDDFRDPFWALWDGDLRSSGVSTGWQSVDRIWRPSPGQLVVVAGIPSHGKSAWTDALLGHLTVHRWRHVLWAPESMPYELHAARLVAAREGKPFGHTIDVERMDDAIRWLKEHFVWINPDVHDTVPAILSRVRALHARRPLHTFTIDPWTEIDHTRERNLREDEFISRELTRIRRFARRHGLVAFVIVHPHDIPFSHIKGAFPVPTSSDLHGGSVWRKKADALLVIWRDEKGNTQRETLTDLHVQKIRRNHIDGVMGKATQLEFNPSTYQYRELGRGGIPVADPPGRPPHHPKDERQGLL
jgi:replicative DNA helicase